jgi:hypothetical protein
MSKRARDEEPSYYQSEMLDRLRTIANEIENTQGGGIDYTTEFKDLISSVNDVARNLDDIATSLREITKHLKNN